MWFATRLYRDGLISDRELAQATMIYVDGRILIGRLALEKKLMTVKQVAAVLKHQADENEPFGRLAVKLGYLSETDLARLLMMQADEAPSMRDILVELGVVDPGRCEDELKSARRRAAVESEAAAAVGELE